MVTLDVYIKRFSKLGKFMEKEAKKILLAHGDEIAALVRDQQLVGQNEKGETMQQGYSAGYAKQRRKRGLQVHYVDLHFTGRMHKGLKARAVPGGVDIRSREPYEQYVRVNFPLAFGLTKQNIETRVKPMLIAALIPKIKEYLIK